MLKKEINSEYDVVIVGAGPAGCVTAKFLSEDYNVLMVDRLKFPRKKPCGGLLVEESQELEYSRKIFFPVSHSKR